jgi:hypothetical protein
VGEGTSQKRLRFWGFFKVSGYAGRFGAGGYPTKFFFFFY